MIVPMQKATLLLSAKEKKEALKVLRKLGVLHVEPMQTPQSEDVNAIRADISKAEKALILLEEATVSPDVRGSAAKGREAAGRLLELAAEQDTVKAQMEEKREIRSWFDRWGDVALDDIHALKEKGLTVRTYRTDRASLKKAGDSDNLMILGEDKGAVYAALITDQADEKLDIPEDVMPKVDVSELDRDMEALAARRQEVAAELTDLGGKKPHIQAWLTALNKDLDYASVLAGLGDAESIVILQGYCPEDTVESLKKTADQHSWGYILQEPDDPMVVPTLLKNPKPLRIIQPLFDFMGTLPGYNEVDVSFIFLVFFSIFYAMIIGDAGYGLIFLGGTIFARIKAPKAPFEPFALFFVLSIATIIWGVVTGTWFGSRAIADIPFLRGLVIENMFSFNDSVEATRFMMKFSFILGLIHLVLGRLVAFFKQLPSIKAVAQLGWALIVVGIFFVADLLVLTNPLPGFVMPLILAGLVLVGVFTNFQKNPVKLIGSFLGTIGFSILDVISSFSDVVSYIRLFAVGMASVTVAASFNGMAKGYLAPVILIFGHGLNIVLGLMSVMVHGVRLNMLEFSGHLGQEWTGKEYKPFAE